MSMNVVFYRLKELGLAVEQVRKGGLRGAEGADNYATVSMDD